MCVTVREWSLKCTMHHLFFIPLTTTLHISYVALNFRSMSDKQNDCLPEDPTWPELKLSHCMYTQTVRDIHAVIENEWDSVKLSACQTAAGRALWKHVINDPFAEILAGETYLRSLFEKMMKDRLNKAREISGVILAVRTLWFDSKIEAALDSFGGGETQVVLLGAGMDTRAYRLGCLKDCSVIEVDLPEVLEVKATLLHSAMSSKIEHCQDVILAKSLTRVAADLTHIDWLARLQSSGFVPDKNTIWVLEGILYYLSQSKAMDVLKIIADSCAITRTVLLADFMNKASTTLSSSTYQFYSDWPEDLLPPLGFSDVKLTQIGDPDAHFGLLHDPMNLFNKLRSLSRSIQTDPENGAPCRRLYLVQASGSPI
uniref:S-adenosyl-L-methionine-dependent methyltransferase n=1 Tax=Kalanchoe fedtschenkoi TaxID=63787 RepID=A0A7N0V3Z5_KALFE